MVPGPAAPDPAPPTGKYNTHIEHASGVAIGDGAQVIVTPSPPPIPFQVPRDIPYFVGREQELAAREQALTAGGSVAAVCGGAGLGGVGKSALAAHFATTRRDFFPDGVLYVSLREHDPLTVLAILAAAYGKAVAAYADLPTRAAAVRAVLALAEEIGDALGERDRAWNLGLLYEGQGQFDQALNLVERSLAVARECGLPEVSGSRQKAVALRAQVTEE